MFLFTPSTLARILSEVGVKGLLDLYTETYGTSRVQFQQLLTSAVKINSQELVTQLLADKLYDVVACRTGPESPLYTAIRSGNIHLVELFLLKEFSMNKRVTHNRPTCSAELDIVSAIEYACVLGQMEVLTVMLRYHQKHRQEIRYE